MEWFVFMLFGHLFGDYVFQNSWMALNKKHSIDACVIHCTVYTTIVTLFLLVSGIPVFWPQLWVLIFISHYILDGTNMVEWWTRFYGIRSWQTNLPRTCETHKCIQSFDNVDWNKNMSVALGVQTSFGSLVYVVIDNTLHLFMMFVIVKFLI